MADRPVPLGERPVLAGLVALLGVAVVVGLLGGMVVLSGTKILGFGGGSGGGDATTSGETLFIPEPEETETPTGPQITLNVDPTPEIQTDPDAEEVDEAEEDAEAVAQDICAVLTQALEDFDQMRTREGQRLCEDITSRASTIENLVSIVEERSPQTVSEYRQRLENRMREVLENNTTAILELRASMDKKGD